MLIRLTLNCRILALIAVVFIVGVVNASDCFTLVVGKDASADGFVLMGHNEDDGAPQIVNHYKMPRQTFPPGTQYTLSGGGKIEQPPETWAYIWSEMPGMLFSDSFVNEWGVCVASDNCPSREDKPVLTEGGLTADLRRLIAQRAKTAREGVHIAGQLVERFGYDASGRTYVISDPNEGWFFCAVLGKHWLAARVPDDQVAVVSNRYAVRQVNLKDTLNYLATSDLVKYAQKRGWYNPQAGVFDFSLSYGDPVVLADSNNFCRQWSGLNHFAASPLSLSQDLPFSVVPKSPVDVSLVMETLRDHYDWTELYRATPNGSPHQEAIGTICNETTQTSFVVQLRADLPLDVGIVYWVTLASPCVSAYIPFHFGIERFPSGYTVNMLSYSPGMYFPKVTAPFTADQAAAFWTFSNYHQKVFTGYGRLGTNAQNLVVEFQQAALTLQKPFEEIALGIYLTDQNTALEMLQNFSYGLYLQALEDLNRGLSGH